MKTLIRITSEIIVVVAFLLLSSFSVMAFDTPKTGADLSKGKAEIDSPIDKASGLKEGIDINSATPEMLSNIPGIDPSIAEGITKYREAKGAFTNLNDLLNVDGITPELLEKINPFLSMIQ